MASGGAESDFGLQGWIGPSRLKQIFLIFSVSRLYVLSISPLAHNGLQGPLMYQTLKATTLQLLDNLSNALW